MHVFSPSASREGFPNIAGLVFLLGALTALDPLSIDMYLPAFSDIQASLHASPAALELSVSAFFIGMALGQLVYGPLADRWGRRRPLLAGMMIYLGATLGCALSSRIETFIAFRMLQALGGCAGMVITRAIVADLYDARRGAMFLSNMVLVMGVAPIVAPSVGAFLTHAVGWRAIFWVLAMGNVVCLTTIAKFLPETLPSERRIQRARPRQVLIDYANILKDRTFLAHVVPNTAIRAGMFAYVAASPFVVIEVLGLPARSFGLVFGLNALGLIGATQVNRLLLMRFTPSAILGGSLWMAAITSGVVLLAVLFHPTTLVLLPALFVFLATLNFIAPNAMAEALSTQKARAGSASALYGSAQWALAFVASFLVSRLHDGTARPMALVIFGSGVVALLGYLILLPSTERAPLPAE